MNGNDVAGDVPRIGRFFIFCIKVKTGGKGVADAYPHAGRRFFYIRRAVKSEKELFL